MPLGTLSRGGSRYASPKEKTMVLRNSLLLSVVCLCVLLCAVGVSAQTRTTPVEVENTPTVKIDATDNTVKAQQSGTWSVGISPSLNTVQTQITGQMYQPWTTAQVIANGGYISWESPQCTGYREARVVIITNNPYPTLKVWIGFRGPDGLMTVGTCSFGTVSQGLISQANFVGAPSVCTFTVPMMSPVIYLRVENNTGNPVTISESSWIYVVT
jgi:hypothetical protein